MRYVISEAPCRAPQSLIVMCLLALALVCDSHNELVTLVDCLIYLRRQPLKGTDDLCALTPLALAIESFTSLVDSPDAPWDQDKPLLARHLKHAHMHVSIGVQGTPYNCCTATPCCSCNKRGNASLTSTLECLNYSYKCRKASVGHVTHACVALT